MDIENIATFLMSIAALAGTYVALRRAWKEEPKVGAEAEHSNVETIGMLSQQLRDAYKQIDELRSQLDSLECHKDYQDYLLRGIARLNGALAANEISIPWMPLSFEEFIQKQKIGG